MSKGSNHWAMQRITAISLVFMAMWLVCAIVATPIMYHGGMTTEDIHKLAIAWYAKPCNALMSILFLIAMFWHGAIGIQVVIEDYVHSGGKKLVAIWLTKIFCFAASVTGIFSVLSIYFKG